MTVSEGSASCVTKRLLQKILVGVSSGFFGPYAAVGLQTVRNDAQKYYDFTTVMLVH